MSIELVEIRDFFAEHLPFSLLSSAALDTLPQLLAIRYLRRGSAFPPAQEIQACLFSSARALSSGGRATAY